ncbi:hypothetical protein QBC38DRAFT_443448 [Podospora fimiseda]|uniref:Heterokaryon incompatibility domain-containing protein n=1 Tax=Podospora fimiseda TaxID=252190 RepID=A0AAN7GVE3_9PEZI|nr:hypothetical protein QBC38DRAFT_443448 [Podospora fimiseda]
MDSFWSTDTGTTQYRVQLGVWTNWSRGPVFGSTLTLTRENGNLLIAFTAFFVSLVATRLWRIACLVIHFAYSTLEPRDGVHHQRQAILRNSASPASAIFTLGQLCFAWRKSAKMTFWRTLPTILFAVASLWAFALATGFSSQISSAITNDVLVNGANCSYLYQRASSGSVYTMRDAAVISSEVSKRRDKALAYSQQCYPSGNVAALTSSRETRTGIFDCGSYVVGRLPIKTIDMNAPCPFRGGICASNSSNLLLDTGLIDSHTHLGINAPSNERLKFRQVLRCAPLQTEGYTISGAGNYSNYTSYHYGFSKGANRSTPLLDPDRSRTTIVEDPEAFAARSGEGTYREQTTFYIAGSKYWDVTHWPNSNYFSTFSPIPNLRQPENDSDVNIIFLLTNGVGFVNKTDDPWYHVNKEMTGNFVRTMASTIRAPIYYSTEGASPMGCLEQYQFCTTASLGLPRDSSGTRCGPLDSFYNALLLAETAVFNRTPDAWNGTDDPEYSYLNNKLYSQFLRFANVLVTTVGFPATIPIGLGAKSLASQTTFESNVIQWSLVEDQWKYDVMKWWSIWLSALQTGFVDSAIGPGPADIERLEPYMVRPEDDHERGMCQSQKVRSTRYTSFSMFGLCFMYAAGVLIVGASYSIEPILDCVAARREKGNNKVKAKGGGAYQEWVVHETLHLQRLGFQGLGRGTWSRCNDNIPVTKPGEMLKSLAIPAHDVQQGKDAAAEKVLSHQTILERSSPITPITSESSESGATTSTTRVLEDESTAESETQETPRVESVAATTDVKNLGRHGTYAGRSNIGSQKARVMTNLFLPIGPLASCAHGNMESAGLASDLLVKQKWDHQLRVTVEGCKFCDVIRDSLDEVSTNSHPTPSINTREYTVHESTAFCVKIRSPWTSHTPGHINIFIYEGKLKGDLTPVSFIKQRLWECSSDEECNESISPPAAQTTWPARVVEILCDTVRVAKFNPDTMAGEFMAFSYCWGSREELIKNPPYRLTVSTMPELQSAAGVSISKMPYSLQDSFRLCKQFGISYIWIDALCIMQARFANDLPAIQDWETESMKMETVYSKAKLTIRGCGRFVA